MAKDGARALETPVSEVEIQLTVNGGAVQARVPVRRLLADFLREDLRLTGTHVGCEQGVCGACTILVDGAPTRSCIVLASQVDGAEIQTIEGVAPTDGLSSLQQAFKDNHGLQCGFCTPGIIMTLSGVDPADYSDEDGLREVLSGNLCRCTGYESILRSVRSAWGMESQ